MRREKSVSDNPNSPVAVYKSLLREIIDRRPSGTRQRIAIAIGKHKSFVSQITNPGYSMPIPTKHLSTIFELCHFTSEERRVFMDAYSLAHPRHTPTMVKIGRRGQMTIPVTVPILSDSKRQRDMVSAIQGFAAQLSALAEKWDEPESDTHRPADKRSARDEKAM